VSADRARSASSSPISSSGSRADDKIVSQLGPPRNFEAQRDQDATYRRGRRESRRTRLFGSAWQYATSSWAGPRQFGARACRVRIRSDCVPSRSGAAALRPACRRCVASRRWCVS
jgi:hypothetical protein